MIKKEMELLEQRSTEGIKGHAEATNPNNSSNSISGSNLLQGVTKSNSFKLIVLINSFNELDVDWSKKLIFIA